MSVVNFLDPIKKLLTRILPGERIKYSPPMKLVWDTEEYNWSNVEEIQMLIRNLPEDIFATLRFNEPNLTVDIYRFPQPEPHF